MTRYEVELTESDAQWTQGLTVGDLYPTHSPKRRILNAVFEAVLANPPKPPRMNEPEWGDRVYASAFGHPDRQQWLRAGLRDVANWTNGRGGWSTWSDLIDPEPTS